MPYIKRELRLILDAKINNLRNSLLCEIDNDQLDGALNYTITRLLRALYSRRYFDQNRALGVLSAVTMEHYRTIVGPYEDTKIAENGDVV